MGGLLSSLASWCRCDAIRWPQGGGLQCSSLFLARGSWSRSSPHSSPFCWIQLVHSLVFWNPSVLRPTTADNTAVTRHNCPTCGPGRMWASALHRLVIASPLSTHHLSIPCALKPAQHNAQLPSHTHRAVCTRPPRRPWDGVARRRFAWAHLGLGGKAAHLNVPGHPFKFKSIAKGMLELWRVMGCGVVSVWARG